MAVAFTGKPRRAWTSELVARLQTELDDTWSIYADGPCTTAMHPIILLHPHRGIALVGPTAAPSETVGWLRDTIVRTGFIDAFGSVPPVVSVGLDPADRAILAHQLDAVFAHAGDITIADPDWVDWLAGLFVPMAEASAATPLEVEEDEAPIAFRSLRTPAPSPEVNPPASVTQTPPVDPLPGRRFEFAASGLVALLAASSVAVLLGLWPMPERTELASAAPAEVAVAPPVVSIPPSDLPEVALPSAPPAEARAAVSPPAPPVTRPVPVKSKPHRRHHAPRPPWWQRIFPW
jgi:hypothetical protein